MKERRTLFDYFKSPKRQSVENSDKSFSDDVEMQEMSSGGAGCSEIIRDTCKSPYVYKDASQPLHQSSSSAFEASPPVHSPVSNVALPHILITEPPSSLVFSLQSQTTAYPPSHSRSPPLCSSPDYSAQESSTPCCTPLQPVTSCNTSLPTSGRVSQHPQIPPPLVAQQPPVAAGSVAAERFGFLTDVRDKEGRRRGSEGYDGSTLYISEEDYARFTPFERQFWDVKREHFDTVVFFKKGKFYELYEEDALIGARLFDLRVTERVNMRMSGFPESGLDYWTRRFLENGYKVARVEQNENMVGKRMRERAGCDEGKGTKTDIIVRELREVITQGTIYNPEHLWAAAPMYLIAVTANDTCFAERCSGNLHTSVVLYDASTGNVYFTSFCDDAQRRRLRTILSQHDVKEMISDIAFGDVPRIIPDGTFCAGERRCEFSNDREHLCFVFLVNYMKKLKREDGLREVRVMRLCVNGRFMMLDDVTLRNMEIFKNSYDGGAEKTLFGAVNFCSTAFGARLLRRWMMTPLAEREEIVSRQQMARIFESVDVGEARRVLGMIGDGERLLARLHNGNLKPRDLCRFVECIVACKRALDALCLMLETVEGGEDIRGILVQCSGKLGEVLGWYCGMYRICEEEVCPEEGNGDELCLLLEEKKAVERRLEEYLERQKKRIGCDGMRFRDIGKELFQMEVPKGFEVPTEYFIVSSTKSVNRFHTGELRKVVMEYVECEERIFQSRGMLLRRAVEALTPYTMLFRQVLNEIAHVDCYLSFATFSMQQNASTPVIEERFATRGMWSPVYTGLVKNDYNAKGNVLVLTGPNMGGKSTFLRTICANVILSQIGMNVCCEEMKTPLFDGIFTRVGASDSLARGESTFMVELLETANILKRATERSLVVIDELGRGTSTRDGECIARAVLEYMKNKGSRVFFSTHYHGVGKMEGVVNAYMGSLLRDGNVVFLYKLMEGTCAESHGLCVARMAGVPENVVKRAEEIRKELKEKQDAHARRGAS